MSFKGHKFQDRLAEQKKAKLELLKRAKEKQFDPEERARIAAERIERAKRREERQKEARKKKNSKPCKRQLAKRKNKCNASANRRNFWLNKRPVGIPATLPVRPDCKTIQRHQLYVSPRYKRRTS